MQNKTRNLPAFFSSTLLAAVLATPAAQALEIRLADVYGEAQGAPDGSAEIVDFSSDQNTVVTTFAGADGLGVQILSLGADGQVSARGLVSLDDAFGAAGVADGASSTALDPLGRGFGAVSLIPEDNGGTAGKVAFFNYREGVADTDRTLVVLDVGFHPDSVTFSDDGTRLVIANEGEITTGGPGDAPGSVSVIDLSALTGAPDPLTALTGLNSSAVTTVDFSPANLGPGVRLDGLRNQDPGAPLTAAIEPEFVKVFGNRAFVSIQEANAVAVLDLATNQFVAIHDLGAIEQLIDASDRDGGALIDDTVSGLPMPDSVGVYAAGGQTLFVTANEGDFRPDDADRIRIKDIDRADIDDAYEAELDARYGGDFQADDALGRLRVSTLDGLNAAGEYEQFFMPGTRSYSIWDADTGALVYDSGSLETLLLSLDPALHNIDEGDPGEFDGRSDDKGPEPEALALIDLGSSVLLALGLERQNGLLLFDITDPALPSFQGYINNALDGLVAPESLRWIAAGDSPTERLTLLAGYEENGGVLGVYQVPEPATLGLLALGLAGLVQIRRRQHR